MGGETKPQGVTGARHDSLRGPMEHYGVLRGQIQESCELHEMLFHYAAFSKRFWTFFCCFWLNSVIIYHIGNVLKVLETLVELCIRPIDSQPNHNFHILLTYGLHSCATVSTTQSDHRWTCGATLTFYCRRVPW